jgi:hypothetical protein
VKRGSVESSLQDNFGFALERVGYDASVHGVDDDRISTRPGGRVLDFELVL